MIILGPAFKLNRNDIDQNRREFIVLINNLLKCYLHFQELKSSCNPTSKRVISVAEMAVEYAQYPFDPKKAID